MMYISALVLGWIGILIFICLFATFQKLAKKNEFGFIHLIMAVMYAMWLPLPFVFYDLLDQKILLVGAVFGFTYLVMMVVTMTLQTGHLVYSAKQENKALWDDRDNWMMGIFSGPFEVLANSMKSIWAIFLAISFWNMGSLVMSGFMTVFSLLIIYFFLLSLKLSLVHPPTFLKKIKSNPILFNLETLLFFLILLIYLQQVI